MYFDALSFLEDERDAWRPFEALATLPDEDLVLPVDAAHGWSARDLAVHLGAWQEHALDVALCIFARHETKGSISCVKASRPVLAVTAGGRWYVNSGSTSATRANNC